MPVQKQPLGERLERHYVAVPFSGCWIWVGASDNAGYGRINIDRKSRQAHRVAYEFFVGQVPRGLELDHLCRIPACMNPAHLEPVTRKVNTDRGRCAEVNRARMSARTACSNGHPYTAQNTRIDEDGHRNCRACRRAATARFKETRRVK